MTDTTGRISAAPQDRDRRASREGDEVTTGPEYRCWDCAGPMQVVPRWSTPTRRVFQCSGLGGDPKCGLSAPEDLCAKAQHRVPSSDEVARRFAELGIR